MPDNNDNKIRAVYYARVSTEEEKQLNALENQILDNEECIKNKGWILVDRYIDEGKSGTTVKRRNEYKRLCDDITKDKFDVIVIKSQERLMRNVLDWHLFVRLLIENNKKLYMYIDNTFYKPDDSLINGIKAILAEDFSIELSKKMKNAHKRRQQTAKTIMGNSRILGYDYVNGELIINEEEAKIVRRIFDMYVNGYGCTSISKALYDDGIVNHNGNPYSESSLNRILQNENYIGTYICNKQYRDFFTKKIVKTDPSEWVIHKNRIPAIIDERTFYKALEIRKGRTQTTTDGRKIGKRSSNHILRDKMKCGICGGKIVRTKVTLNSGNVIYKWVCSTFIKYGRLGIGLQPEKGCSLLNISDIKLKDALINLSNDIQLDKSIIEKTMSEFDVTSNKKQLQDELKKVEKEINDLKTKREKLLDKYLEGIIDDDMYRTSDERFTSSQDTLKTKYADIQDEISNIKTKTNKIDDILKIIQSNELNYDSICELIEKILCYNDCSYVYFTGLPKPICINQTLSFGAKVTGDKWVEYYKSRQS